MRPASDRSAGWYTAVWRWHFYAGLFCIPFVLWLALTGSIYLWRPQIEAWLDRPYAHLGTSGPAATPDAEVAAALKAVPGSHLHQYVLPQTPDQAVNILVTRGGADKRVYVDPHTLKVLHVVTEEKRPMRIVFHLHGELLAGAWGSYLVETAACWAIVMILTGLYLWWPRGRGIAGTLYPRLGVRGRPFWRDLHAVTGVWVSLFALGLILTGLPWASAWGTYLTEVRQLTGTSAGPVDWSIGGRTPKADPLLGPRPGAGGMVGMPGMSGPTAASALPPPGDLARVIATVRGQQVAPPVLIAPPSAAGTPWSITSDAADRPLRSDLKVDGRTGHVVGRTDFAQRQWIDRLVAYGIALHEGAFFGLANQLLGTVVALGLMLLSLSGAVMWWKRRPVGLLGAPVPRGRPRCGPALVLAVVLLGLYLPMFGLTLIATLVAERLLLRRIAPVRRWLALRSA